MNLSHVVVTLSFSSRNTVENDVISPGTLTNKKPKRSQHVLQREGLL